MGQFNIISYVSAISSFEKLYDTFLNQVLLSFFLSYFIQRMEFETCPNSEGTFSIRYRFRYCDVEVQTHLHFLKFEWVGKLLFQCQMVFNEHMSSSSHNRFFICYLILLLISIDQIKLDLACLENIPHKYLAFSTSNY